MAAAGLAWRGSWAFGRAGLRAWRGRGTGRCGRSGAAAVFSPNERPQQASVFPVRVYGNDSALDHILGISKEETECPIGQHPPPVSAFKDEQENLLELRPDQPENPKTLRIAIIGAPNAGKSTLSNQILGRKVLPVSKKVHTTRCNAEGVVTKEETQLVILDTPGLTSFVKAKRHNLEDAMLHDPFKSLKKADLVLVLVDVSDRYTRNSLHPQVLKCLASSPQIPSVLVLNKVDLLKNKSLLLELVTQLTEGVVDGKTLNVRSMFNPVSTAANPGDLQAPPELQAGSDRDPKTSVKEAGSNPAEESTNKQRKGGKKGWPHFGEIFMLAAVNGEDVDVLKRYLLKRAKPGPWEFHSEVLTSQSPQEVCDNIIREKLLEYLPEEVPYAVGQRTEIWEEGPSGELVILQNLVVQKDTHVKMLIGHRGQLISQIAHEAGRDLMEAFLCDVKLKLCVKLRK